MLRLKGTYYLRVLGCVLSVAGLALFSAWLSPGLYQCYGIPVVKEQGRMARVDEWVPPAKQPGGLLHRRGRNRVLLDKRYDVPTDIGLAAADGYGGLHIGDCLVKRHSLAQGIPCPTSLFVASRGPPVVI